MITEADTPRAKDKEQRQADQQSKIHPRPIIIVQGGQWGSEAKGAIAAWMCQRRKVDYAVRTGGVNAGHTVHYPGANGQEVFKMQQLPTGWVSSRTTLVLGAGTFVHPQILNDEIKMVNEALGGGEDIRTRLVIDNRVSLHLPEHQEQAKLENRHHAIGATGKGCSVALVHKIAYRGRGCKLFKEWLEGTQSTHHHYPYLQGSHFRFADTAVMLHDAYDGGKLILLEGTQGTKLDLHLGPYPYTTHKQTTAAQWVAEAGLSPNMQYEVALVVRTYPIRVAGNSGPMPQEITWPNLAREINRKLMLHRMPQRVKSYAIEQFEAALHDIATSGKYDLPGHYDGSVDYDMHTWAQKERERFRVALSEMHKDALNMQIGRAHV